ncbi:MAG: hypothetical protein WA687_10785 [Solirubrobacterales bacterium]
MANELGKITAPPATTAPKDGKEPPAKSDSSLPDPTKTAKRVLFGGLVVAFVVAWIWNILGTGAPFEPTKDEDANVAFFAGFYAAAQVIERLLELISPVLPRWEIPTPQPLGGAPTPSQEETAKAAQIKADRAAATHGIAAVLGVAVSCGFGLFFLQTVGFHVSNTIDTFATGILVAAGTKPLHDFISGLQNKNTPTTGTATQ